MTQQFTKEDYQQASDFIKFKENQDYMETEEYYHIFKYYGAVIKSALQLAIAAQPRPIKDLRFNSSGPNWDFSDPVLFRIEYRETGIITHDVGRVMIDNVLNKAELPDNKYLEYDRITHFYDLSFLPKPQERKD